MILDRYNYTIPQRALIKRRLRQAASFIFFNREFNVTTTSLFDSQGHSAYTSMLNFFMAQIVG